MDDIKNKIILDYLDTHGYESAKEAFVKEISGTNNDKNMNDTDEMNISESDHPTTIPYPLNVLLFDNVLKKHNQSVKNVIKNYNNNEINPNRYNYTYEHLLKWISSLPIEYQIELEAICWPIFIHIYFILIEKGFFIDACQFYLDYHGKYLNLPHNIYNNELKQLKHIQKINQLYTNPLAIKYRNSKIIINLSSVTSQLLHAYLNGMDYMLILNIINDYINENIIFYGIPKTSKLKNIKEYYTLLNLSTETKLKKMTDDIRYKRLKNNTSKKLSKSTSLSSLHSKIPLPNLSKKIQYDIIDDILIGEQSYSNSSSKLPSIAMYTFINTQDNPINSTCISLNGETIVTGMNDSTIHTWSLSKGSIYVNDNLNDDDILYNHYNSSSIKTINQQSNICKYIGHSKAVYSVDYSLDHKFLLSSSADKTIRLWSTENHNNLVCYKGHLYSIWDVSFSPLGFYFASASADYTARLWSTDRITPLRIFSGHTKDVNKVIFHPNCQYIATASNDATIRLWDISSGNYVRLFTSNKQAINTIAFSKDGKYIASGGQDKKIHIYDIMQGKELITLSGHNDSIIQLDFDYNSNHLISSSYDGSIKYWNFNQNISTQNDLNEQIQDQMILNNETEIETQQMINNQNDDDDSIKTWYTKDMTYINYLKYSPRNYVLSSGIFQSNESK